MVSERRAFGERLKRQRERAGVTLQKISQSSKLPVSLFTGLEAGDCSRWPAGLYARAYVRGYAEAIGLNPDETVEEFVAAFGLAAKPEGPDTSPQLSSKAPALRLSLVEDPVNFSALRRRAGLAATELILGALIAVVSHVGLASSAWVTVSLVIAYFAGGRLVSDDPLLYWMFKRLRQPSGPVAGPVEDTSEVGVAEPSRTIA